MSFFGLPERPGGAGHNTRMPGFGQAQDPFASLTAADTDNAYVGTQREHCGGGIVLILVLSVMTLKRPTMDWEIS